MDSPVRRIDAAGMSLAAAKRLRNTLSSNVRRERLARAWTQESLAHKATLTQTYVSQIESAQRAVSIDAVAKIAHALGIEAHVLLQAH